MSKVKSTLAAALTLAIAASASQAATFNLYGVVSGAFDSSFNPLPVNSTVTGPVTTITPSGTPAIYQIDYYFTISNLAPGEAGFGSLAMDVNLTSGLNASVGGGYNPSAETYSYTQLGKTKTQAIWAGNADSGTSNSDLQAIVGYLANPPYNIPSTAADPRATFGQNSPGFIGTVYVQWDGTSPQSESLGNVQYTTYDVNAAGGAFSAGHNVVDPNVINFVGGVVTPEPASLGVLALGGVALLARRRKA